MAQKTKSTQGRLNIVNRDEYPVFMPSPKTHYYVKTKLKSLKFKRISHDDVFKKRKKAGESIEITNPELYVNGQKPIDGIFSPLFGADTTEDAPIFSCDCHNLTGGTNRGHICPKCGTEVRTIDADLRITHYIDIAPYHIITYHGMVAFTKLFKKDMATIISTAPRIDAGGHTIKDGSPTILSLYEDYDELYAEKIGLPKKVVFTTKIPVYTSRLRPLMKMYGNNLSILDVNKWYLSIVRSRNILKTAPMISSFSRELEILKILNQIQKDFNLICDHLKSQADGKYGVFRRSLASGRVDNSARMVITLGTDLMAHEVDLPYQTVMVICEELIANRLSTLENISISKAINIIEQNIEKRNPKFVKIINQLLREGYGVWTLVNRNPTISESGVEYMRIRKIHENGSDMTMHLPPDPLNLFAADFDGDQCTAIIVLNKVYHPLFMPMCTTYAFIDRANGKFNQGMNFKREYAALLSAGWDIDSVIDKYLTDPDEDSYEAMRQLGLDDITSEEAQDTRKRVLKAMLNSTLIDNPVRSRYLGFSD